MHHILKMLGAFSQLKSISCVLGFFEDGLLYEKAIFMAVALDVYQKGSLNKKGQSLYSFAERHFSLDNCVHQVYNVYHDV